MIRLQLHIALLLLISFPLFAQKEEVRRKMDLVRKSISFSDEKALEKSRAFIRLDSTYYLGYMYEGAFRYNRANDEMGFRQAIIPLERAFRLIEKDYDKELRTRTGDIITFFKVTTAQTDYGYIAYWLQHCYQNIERPDKAFDVLNHVRERDLQMETAVESYNTMAWIFHRNRMYTSIQFPFLKNSVRENDSIAYLYLDSAILKANRDAELNIAFFDPSYINRQYYFTYHYKAILFTYDFQLDSAQYYYDLLLRSGYYSSNNYANFQYMKGEFSLAEQFYNEAEMRDDWTDKHTREYFYMRSIMDIMQGKPEKADSLLKDIIDRQGSTPGYGWHSIGLSRALMYEGLTAESQNRLNKAARFNELHIGTTWGQEQYNLNVALLNYMNKLHFSREFDFEHRSWLSWLNPLNWLEYIRLSYEVQQYKMILATQLAANPERAVVIYTLFSSENLMGFDEVWNMIDGFSDEYFIKLFRKLAETDKRKNIRKYFNYFVARLLINEGEEEQARVYLNKVMNELVNATEYDTMLYARVCETFALSYNDDSPEHREWKNRFYEGFPQLALFSDLQMNFRLVVSTNDAAQTEKIIDEMKKCDAEWEGDQNDPVAELKLIHKGDECTVDYKVYSPARPVPVVQGQFRLNKKEDDKAGILLAYRLFGIKKMKTGEEVKAETKDDKKEKQQ
ncbi:MAG: hypothetical protein Fur0041_18700 [Bacteroidia bacterium]